MELPTKRREAQNYNPKLLVLFGKPKSGKSTIMASLESNLIIDLEDGYRALSVMDIQVRTVHQLFEVEKLIKNKINELNGDFPYKYITIDNATRLEEMSLPYAAHLYRSTAMGQGWGMMKDPMGKPIKDQMGKPMPDPKADVSSLHNGAGYR